MLCIVYTIRAFLASGAGTSDDSGAPEFTPVFSGVRITRSLVLFVFCLVDRCVSFSTFSFDHCVVCSSIHGIFKVFV